MEQYRVNTSLPIGRALLINIRTFMNDSNDKFTRHGSETDMKNLKSVLDRLQFDVLEKTDITKNEITDTVEQFAKDLNASPVDISFVCIMSHGGGKDYLKSHDGKRVHPEEDILEKFSNSNCRGMNGHPKMFLIQACRGGKTETMRDDAEPRINNIGFTSTLRDAIIAFSTVPGFASFREVTTTSSSKGGAWFIQAFCKVFGQATVDQEVQQLFKSVSRDLSKMQTDAQETQTMEVIYRSFEKDLFFIPLTLFDPDSFQPDWVNAWKEQNPIHGKTQNSESAHNTSLFNMLFELEKQKNVAQSSFHRAIETCNQMGSKNQKKKKEAVNEVTRTWNVVREAWEQLLSVKNDLGIIIRRISQEDFVRAELEYDKIMIDY